MGAEGNPGFLNGCIHSKTEKEKFSVLAGQSRTCEYVCVSCHNFRCKSSVEVVQGHVCYSTQLCLTAL